MPHIDNTGSIPPVREGSQTLKIIGSQLVEGTAFQQPDVPETKLEITFRVITPGEEQVTFRQQVTLNLGDKAILGNIYRAAMNTKAIPRGGIDTDDLDGKVIDCMVSHTEGGWPKVVNQSAYPHRGSIQAQQELVATQVAGTDSQTWEPDMPSWGNTDEPPF